MVVYNQMIIALNIQLIYHQNTLFPVHVILYHFFIHTWEHFMYHIDPLFSQKNKMKLLCMNLHACLIKQPQNCLACCNFKITWIIFLPILIASSQYVQHNIIVAWISKLMEIRFAMIRIHGIFSSILILNTFDIQLNATSSMLMFWNLLGCQYN